MTALKACREEHRLPVETRDGRHFVANLSTGMQESVFFLGEYEPFLTRITTELIDAGDVCVDVGANFGWYTTLMAVHCGDNGQVHAFEPVPDTFGELERTYELAGRPENIRINRGALGDHDGTVEMHVFDDVPTGHASLRRERGDTGARVFESTITTLDKYLESNGIERVDFIKVDIEGAEMMFLKGAERVFRQHMPPILLMEMALATSTPFGYLPGDLIDLIRRRGDYEFYAADEIGSKVYQITGFAEGEIGANVFCVPRSSSRRERIRQFLRS